MKAILTYHSIDDSGSVLSVDARTLTAHIGWLVRNVAVVPLTDLCNTDHEHAVAITFDDGFQNFADVALPVLREHGATATVFVATDHVAGSNAWSGGDAPNIPRLPLMDWDTLARISQYGISIGSHTRTHPDLKRIAPEQLHGELVGAAEIIAQRLGLRPRTLAYPYGSYNDIVLSMARSTYDLACTTELRALASDEDPLELPRLDAYYFRRGALLEQFGTAHFQRSIWVRRHGRAVRRALTYAGARL